MNEFHPFDVPYVDGSQYPIKKPFAISKNIKEIEGDEPLVTYTIENPQPQSGMLYAIHKKLYDQSNPDVVHLTVDPSKFTILHLTFKIIGYDAMCHYYICEVQ